MEIEQEFETGSLDTFGHSQDMWEVVKRNGRIYPQSFTNVGCPTIGQNLFQWKHLPSIGKGLSDAFLLLQSRDVMTQDRQARRGESQFWRSQSRYSRQGCSTSKGLCQKTAAAECSELCRYWTKLLFHGLPPCAFMCSLHENIYR